MPDLEAAFRQSEAGNTCRCGKTYQPCRFPEQNDPALACGKDRQVAHSFGDVGLERKASERTVAPPHRDAAFRSDHRLAWR